MIQHRKFILIVLLTAILLWYGGDWLMQAMLVEPLAARGERTEKLRQDIRELRRLRDKAHKAEMELEVFKTQSLPSSLEVARSQYQAWLLALVEHVALANPNVDSSEPVKRKAFHVLSFALHGKGTLEQLTRFLFEFYSTDHLHQIRSLSITPVQESSLLELAIGIEALVMPQATSKDRLTSRRSKRLASPQLEDYQAVVQRNLFGVSATSDSTLFTYLTAVNYVNGLPEAWFSVRSTDEILHLRQGDTIEVGQFKGTLIEIAESDVLIESDGERWLLTVGENLAQASALPPEY